MSGFHPVILFAAVLLVCRPVSCDSLAKGFSDDFAVGLYQSMSGFDNFADGLGKVMKAAQDNPDLYMECATEFGNDDPACKYVTFLVSATVAGVIIFPVIMIFGCCGFCCGRSCKNCECCCKVCNAKHGAACCNNMPTRKEYPIWEHALVWFCLFVGFAAVLSFGTVGFLAFRDAKAGWDGMVEGAVEFHDTPNVLIDRIGGTLDNILDGTKSFVTETVNPQFDKVEDVRENIGNIRENLSSLRLTIEELQFLVEGCANDVDPAECTLANREQFHNKCTNGVRTSDEPGVGVVMDNSENSPQCVELSNTGEEEAVACPCCQDCNDIINDIDSVLDGLPTDETIDDMDQRIDETELEEQFDEATREWETQKDNLKDAVSDLNEFAENEQEYKDYLGQGTVDGLGAGLFALCWVICAIIVCALGTSFQKGACGGCLWWVAFVIGVLYVTLIVSPGFGIIGLISGPFSDICDALPGAGGTSEQIFVALPEDASTDDVRDLLDKCLFAPDNYIWPLVDQSKQSLKDQLDEFGASRMNDTSIDDSLAVTEYTADYDIDIIEDMNSDQGTYGIDFNCPAGAVGEVCTARQESMTVYQTMIQTRVDTIQPRGRAINGSIENLKDIADQTKVDLENVKADLTDLLDSMIDDVWDVGKCDIMFNAYEGLRQPLCDEISPVFLSAWACLFMIGIFMPVLLCATCKAAKLAHVIREGPAKDDDAVAEGVALPPPIAPAVANPIPAVEPDTHGQVAFQTEKQPTAAMPPAPVLSPTTVQDQPTSEAFVNDKPLTFSDQMPTAGGYGGAAGGSGWAQPAAPQMQQQWGQQEQGWGQPQQPNKLYPNFNNVNNVDRGYA